MVKARHASTLTHRVGVLHPINVKTVTFILSNNNYPPVYLLRIKTKGADEEKEEECQ